MTTRPRAISRRIYAVDVGTTLPDRHGRSSFAWARVNPEKPKGIIGSSCIETLSACACRDLTAGRSVALGFEAPLFIPIPTASSRLSRGRGNEGSPSWAAPPGLTVATLGLHQAAWILRCIADRHRHLVTFRLAPTAWPPKSDATTLFCWEAFVSGTAHSSTHIQDAATAVMAFVNCEESLADATAVTADNPLSLIGAAALWSHLTVDLEVLRKPTVVLKPTTAFGGSVRILNSPKEPRSVRMRMSESL